MNKPYFDAMGKLKSGNKRYVEGNSNFDQSITQTRDSLTDGQQPFACIVTCSDSRVVPEYIYDQTLGSLFVIRLAGNVITPEALGSIEYACAHLKTSLVMVMGHTGCGAIKTVLDPNFNEQTNAPSNLKTMILSLRSQLTEPNSSNDLDYNVKKNVSLQMNQLMKMSELINTQVQLDEIKVVGSVYDLNSGTVSWVEPETDQSNGNLIAV